MAKKGIHSVLYVLECNDERFIKIGICKSMDILEQRVRSLQTGNPFKINILHAECRPSAKDAEKYLHYTFQSNKTIGEWFEGITLHDIKVKLMLFHDQI